MPKNYTKRPVTIQAVQWTGNNFEEVHDFAGDTVYLALDYDLKDTKEVERLRIRTLEGVMSATNGDYIIKGVKGEFYACKPDIFSMTYERSF